MTEPRRDITRQHQPATPPREDRGIGRNLDRILSRVSVVDAHLQNAELALSRARQRERAAGVR
jgi:hypothetical protein